MAKRITRPFRFKRFEVYHSTSAHKVGVDGVLVGLWCGLPDEENPKVLDVGCGSGVISLIMAQRIAEKSDYFEIMGIDIDEPSVSEARMNFLKSPWCDYLVAERRPFEELLVPRPFSMIVSNPPYFDSGIGEPETRRELARHCGGLSPETLISRTKDLLAKEGLLSMIVPSEQAEALTEYGKGRGLVLERLTLVKGHAEAPVKRALLEFRKTDFPRGTVKGTELILETSPGVPTAEYRNLGKEFYLYF